jgi:hypothetical protein
MNEMTMKSELGGTTGLSSAGTDLVFGLRTPAITSRQPGAPSTTALATLLQNLEGVEEFFHNARRLTADAVEQQIELKRRAERAETEKARLEAELLQLRSQLESVDKVPRWVRRVFGATPAL